MVHVGGCCTGALLDWTGSFVAPFLVAGSLMTVGGLVCLPVRKIARWEHARNERRQPAAANS